MQTTMTAAAAIKAAAQDVRSEGRAHGTRKVFVSYVYDRLAPMNPGLTLAAFKSLCLELNNAGELDLSRLDLVEMYDTATVQRAEIVSMGDTLHFVYVD